VKKRPLPTLVYTTKEGAGFVAISGMPTASLIQEADVDADRARGQYESSHQRQYRALEGHDK
jgi:hypothetical protein